MKSVTGKEVKVTVLHNNMWKINKLDSDTYRTLALKLNSEITVIYLGKKKLKNN